MALTHVEEVQRAVLVVKTWERADQIWWRALLATEPRQALLIVELAVLLDARPVSDEAL